MKSREKQNWHREHTQKRAICECTTFGFYQSTNQIIDRSLSINQLKNKSIDLSISQPKF